MDILVTFTVTPLGSACTFPGGLSYVSVRTNGSGIAVSPVCTANSQPGGFILSAEVVGFITPTLFLILLGPPSSISLSRGDNQSAQTLATFPTPVEVIVRDSGSNVLSGYNVLFECPPSLPYDVASCIFSETDNTSVTVLTDSNGKASASFGANRVPGLFTITASVVGNYTAPSFNFVERNIVKPPANITLLAGNNSAIPSDGYFQVFSVQVSDGFGLLGKN